MAHFFREDLSLRDLIQIKELIMKAAESNMFFAHRVWFFLKASLINENNKEQAMKIVLFLSELEVLASKNAEKLYLANSDQLIRLVYKTNITGIIDPQCLQIFSEEEHLAAER